MKYFVVITVLVSNLAAAELTVTAYCPCIVCCGKWSIGTAQRTASGTIPVQGRTAAASKDFRFGQKVVLFGHTYIVEDRVHSRYKSNRVDIFFNNHKQAKQFGKRKVKHGTFPNRP